MGIAGLEFVVYILCVLAMLLAIGIAHSLVAWYRTRTLVTWYALPVVVYGGLLAVVGTILIPWFLP